MAAMIPTRFDWSRLIAEMTDERFGIPPDVTFQIEENGELHEVKAHKTILGMVSPTFKTMFYATNVGDKTADVIKIEKTTAPAFQIMMDAVYNVKSIEASLEGKSVHEVFDVLILVERYQIVELMEAAKEHLGNYPVTDDTVLVVAGDAKEYTNMFEAEAQQLLCTCAKFLKTKLKDLNAVTKYAAEHEDRGEALATLLARMNAFAPTECANCKKEICQDGEIIKGDEFREGLVVTNNRAYGSWGNYDYGTGRVTNLDAIWVGVVNIKPGVTQNGVNGVQFEAGVHTVLHFIRTSFGTMFLILAFCNDCTYESHLFAMFLWSVESVHVLLANSVTLAMYISIIRSILVGYINILLIKMMMDNKEKSKPPQKKTFTADCDNLKLC